MNHRFTDAAAALLCLGMAAVMLPQAAAEVLLSAEQSAAVSAAAPTYTYRKVTYLDSDALTALLKDIMYNGNCGLFTDQNGTKATGNLAVGGALNNSQKYYARTDSGVYSWWGFQCYIYAQGVAARIYDEIVNHGPEDGAIFDHLIQAMGAAPSLTYSMMRDARIMPGAYMRTTINTNGAYNSSYGHSLIILEYDEESITVLEGNALGHGEIECNTMSYDAFNSRFLTGQGRYIAHVMQPNDKYYQDTYGLSWGNYASPVAVTTTTTTTVTTTTVTAPEFWETPELELHRTGVRYSLGVPGEYDLVWTSSDPDVAAVDENGNVTPLTDGEAVITAESADRSYDFALSIAETDWDYIGDFDGDGSVSAKDSMQVLQIAANALGGFEQEISQREMLVADVDDDGNITISDAQQVLRFYSIRTLMESSESSEEIWRSLLN